MMTGAGFVAVRATRMIVDSYPWIPGVTVHDVAIRMIELLALSSTLTVALTGLVSAPPMRKKTSWIRSGSLALPGPGSRPRAGPAS